MNPDGTHGAEHVTDEGIELVDVVRLDTALAGIEELGDHLRAASAEIRRLEAELEAAREALRDIRDHEPDKSSTDQTAFFWRWAKERAARALDPPREER